jgi:hypothetical protein
VAPETAGTLRLYSLLLLPEIWQRYMDRPGRCLPL